MSGRTIHPTVQRLGPKFTERELFLAKQLFYVVGKLRQVTFEELSSNRRTNYLRSARYLIKALQDYDAEVKRVTTNGLQHG